jgi:hypothetical protein
MSFPPGTEMFQFPGFAFILLLDSENKYLRLISVGPKIAAPFLKEGSRPVQARSQALCGLASR